MSGASDTHANASAIPVAPAERLGSIDALRGIALLGVLTINLETIFRVSIFQQFLVGPPERGIERWIDAVLVTFIDMKAFALFSLLFGVGLAIQFERLARTGRRTGLLVRRLVILLAFGLVHLFLIWNGDILTEYAIAGLVVLPFLLGPAWLMGAGCAVFLGFYVIQSLLPAVIAFPSHRWLVEQVADANRVYAFGSFADILAFRVREVAGFLPLLVLVMPRTMGLFLLGALAWRAGLVQHAHRVIRPLWLFAGIAAATGIVLTLASSARVYSGWPSLGRAENVAWSTGTILLALGYAAFAIAVRTTGIGRRWLGWAEPVGRMAFTNYVVQSLVLSLIFYGYGLGLFGKLDLATGLALVLVIYVAQVLGSHLWLRRFRYGPLEWLWRTLMYGRTAVARDPRIGAA